MKRNVAVSATLTSRPDIGGVGVVTAVGGNAGGARFWEMPASTGNVGKLGVCDVKIYVFALPDRR